MTRHAIESLHKSDPSSTNQRMADRVEQVAMALDAYFSYERGLDPYIDELHEIVKEMKGSTE